MLINDYVFLDPKVKKTRKVLGVLFVKREGRKHTIISALKPAEVVEMWAWKEYVNLSVIYTQPKDFLCGGKPRYNATMVTAVNRMVMQCYTPLFS